jgi:SOS response regulatory protein OraA/RecX
MGYDRAERFLSRLEEFGLVAKQRLGAKLPRVVIPQKIEDLKSEVVELLGRHGFAPEDVRKIFTEKQVPAKDSGCSVST